MRIRLNHLIIGLYVLGIVSILSACKKNDNASLSTSTNTQMAFALSANGSVSPVSVSGNPDGLTTNGLATNASGNASITWTSGIANVSGFKLEAKKKGLDIEITSRNLTSINLFAATPATISAAIDTGIYREIELRVLFTKSATATLPLTLKGNYTSTTGTVTPIEFDFNDDATIKIAAENITVDGSTDIAAIAKLDVSKLVTGFAASALDNATRTNGTIVISSTANTNIYNFIKANINGCGRWGGFEHHDKRERK
ncbi:MAG: hypothetical protein JWQ34_2880 [Mucilaginibacter sp.]|uniref:hypothetical protein n=1 Tax=Mucilaginibacter sp. TaxID=1882438 RepID=UPI00262D1BFB|nr:hypothetical protein [Mucilaginibacter sp.]MDB5004655.1 hypothetical protein [Mucilaginibacter sp.]